MDEFNSNDYQGRDKKHVENNYKIAYYAMMVFFSIVGLMYLYSLVIRML